MYYITLSILSVFHFFYHSTVSLMPLHNFGEMMLQSVIIGNPTLSYVKYGDYSMIIFDVVFTPLLLYGNIINEIQFPIVILLL